MCFFHDDDDDDDDGGSGGGGGGGGGEDALAVMMMKMPITHTKFLSVLGEPSCFSGTVSSVRAEKDGDGCLC